MSVARGNLFEQLPDPDAAEEFLPLWSRSELRIERIVSHGHATPAGQWYDQAWDEWVLVVRGAAGLRIEGREALVELREGDWLLLPAGCRHRVEWTAPEGPTIWLAIHAGEVSP